MRWGLVLAALAIAGGTPPAYADATAPTRSIPRWTTSERAVIRSLWIGEREAPPPDPSNRVAESPEAARLGHRLFFDPRLSAGGDVSCATCHRPELAFTDGLRVARGAGLGRRNTPSIASTAFSPWLFWDGRKDSQWSQALGPMESPVEHAGDRTQFAHVIASDPDYATRYQTLFGPLPPLADAQRFPRRAGPVDGPRLRTAWEGMAQADRDAVSTVYANLGKAIAAYERLILHGPSRFDRFARALLADDPGAANLILDAREQAGLRLFIGRAQCTRCHNGPQLSNYHFHNSATPQEPGIAPDRGRAAAVQAVLEDEFNCVGPHSDAGPRDCAELRFMKRDDPLFEHAFRTPSLRDVARTAPYMHAGQLPTLADVLQHYNDPPPPPAGISELTPLGLAPQELSQIEAFLRTLDSPPEVDPAWLVAP